MPRRRPTLIVISGPIASGKSTLASAVVAELRDRGHVVALTDLDTVAGMALPSLSDWEQAHRVHAQLVGAWLRTEVDVVVDEGTSTRHEVELILTQVPDGIRVRQVVLTADFERSLQRAQSDPTRGLSRQRDFLYADHRRYADELPHLPSDLRLDVEGRTPPDLARRVIAALWDPLTAG